MSLTHDTRRIRYILRTIYLGSAIFVTAILYISVTSVEELSLEQICFRFLFILIQTKESVCSGRVVDRFLNPGVVSFLSDASTPSDGGK